MRDRWEGTCWSWERVSTFGRERPTPWLKSFVVRASNEPEARALLAITMGRQGYALGGLVGVERLPGKTPPKGR